MRSKALSRKLVFILALGAATSAATGTALASPFVYRPITLPRSDWSLDFGLGLGHDNAPDLTGLGLNLEMAAGLTSFLQLGIRTGFRLNDDGRALQADKYGRTFETETYGTGFQSVANPEISLRWALVHSTAELALEGRLYLPVEKGTNAGVMIALPIAIHLGSSVRLDTGLYLPIIFDKPDTRTVISFPFHLWIQANNGVYLGPLTGVQIHNPGGHTSVPLGFGLGVALSYEADLKTWILFPDLSDNGSAKNFGVGVGIQVRF